jgi:hypothetical protein
MNAVAVSALTTHRIQVRGESSTAVAAAPDEAYVIRESDYDHVQATAFNVMFAIWRRRTLPDACRRFVDAGRDLARRHPEGIGLSHVIDVEAVPPDGETRVVIAEMMRLPGVNYFAITHDEAGFKAAALRAVTLGVSALARPTCKVVVHPTLAAAAMWQEARQREMGRRESASEIEAILRGLRDFHRAQYP